MARAGWGIIGPGSIAHNFADGLAQCASGRLVAIAGRNDERRDRFGDAYGVEAIHRHRTTAALLADPAVDAVYIATPHPWHAALAIECLHAGKPVLVEKPAGMTAAEVTTVTELAAAKGLLFIEAFMYRCHPQIARLLEILASGEIGRPLHVRTSFGFNATFDPASRLFDKALGGGGILDVGGYPVSLARLVAGAARDLPFDEPVAVKGTGLLAATGVDAVAYGLLTFAGGFTAEIACAVSRQMENSAVITGEKGCITLPDPWVPGRNAGPSDAVIHVQSATGERTETLRHAQMLFAFEAEMASRAVADGLTAAPHPAMSPAESRGNAIVLDRWRAELGYVNAAEALGTNRPLPPVLPASLPRIPLARIDGLSQPVSRLVLGCDNKNDLGAAAPVWDAWIEAGGNAFDTGFVYGGGLHETVLGQWIAARGVARDVVVIAKGAHTPYCTPEAMVAQLDISLGRLGLDHAPIYILHRDNPDVPVGEFVDALNQQHRAGKIGVFGGSNWSTARLAAANAYAAENGLSPMKLLNNNLSLAVMERPIWPGCLGANTAETLAFLRAGGITHLSWSAQARGYFLPEALRNRLPADIGPDACFGSPANAERRRRAEVLAAARGVSAHNVALAWVLAQPFPSLALVGPRSAGEIASTLPALALSLSAEEVLWLNLEADAQPM